MKFFKLIEQLTREGFQITFQKHQANPVSLNIILLHRQFSGSHYLQRHVAYTELQLHLAPEQLVCDQIEHMAKHWRDAVVLPSKDGL